MRAYVYVLVDVIGRFTYYLFKRNNEKARERKTEKQRERERERERERQRDRETERETERQLARETERFVDGRRKTTQTIDFLFCLHQINVPVQHMHAI